MADEDRQDSSQKSLIKTPLHPQEVHRIRKAAKSQKGESGYDSAGFGGRL
jgi:hypothetical protein